MGKSFKKKFFEIIILKTTQLSIDIPNILKLFKIIPNILKF